MKKFFRPIFRALYILENIYKIFTAGLLESCFDVVVALTAILKAKCPTDPEKIYIDVIDSFIKGKGAAKQAKGMLTSLEACETEDDMNLNSDGAARGGGAINPSNDRLCRRSRERANLH
jgi:hypothetical protein